MKYSLLWSHSKKRSLWVFSLHLKSLFVIWTIPHHCGFSSVLPLLSSLTKYGSEKNVSLAGETDFGFLSIRSVASFYLKFSCHFSWRFILSLHLQLSVVLISLCCPSICQNFLLIARNSAFHVFFLFMLYDKYPHNKTKYVSKFKKNHKKKHGILKQKVCWSCQFPGTTS